MVCVEVDFVLTIIYHFAAVDVLDVVNLMVHALLAIVMLLDLLVVRHQILLSHALFTVGLAILYSGFSLIYFLAGGTNRKLDSSIYELMNWHKPLSTLWHSAWKTSFVLLIHLVCWSLCKIRYFIYCKLQGKNVYKPELSAI